jgi:hypothetical protein
VASGLTLWRARVAHRGDRSRILCGRQVRGIYDCQEVIAWRYIVSTSEGAIAATGVVVVPGGLTDAGSLGEYRWSRHAQDRIGRGEDPTRDKRTGPPQPREPGIAGSARLLLGKGPKGFRRPAHVPVVFPCPRGHRNLVDEDVLKP